MFKKSRWKIVIAILSVLVVLLFGTFCVIYLASYVEMTNENRQLLTEYVDNYTLPEEGHKEMPDPEWHGGAGPSGRPPRMELSTFYSVVISPEGQVLKVDTADVSTLDEEALSDLAREILASGKEEGVEKNLIYRAAEKDGYVLVAFLDNTVMLENIGTLLNYTLIFGGVALVLLFFLARFLAGRIVGPLEESYKRQKQFISDAGHELKTPVAVINANAEILSREIGENQWLSNIQYENERMSALITQLLELARTEQVVPSMEELDFSRLVCGELLPFESVAYDKGVGLAADIGENIHIWGNSVQLKQLTSILLDNAISHSPQGSPVELVLREEKGKAILSVINCGEEIPEEQRPYLFERFYRGDAARTGEKNHYGLGLAIAQAIAHSHKGSIRVRCGQGKVEFCVKLPLQNRNRKN